MSESDANLTVETASGPELIRVVRDGAEQEQEPQSWWPKMVTDDNQWESWL